MKDGSVLRHTFDHEPTATGTRLIKRFEAVKLDALNKVVSEIRGVLVAPRLLKGDVQRIKANLEGRDAQ